MKKLNLEDWKVRYLAAVMVTTEGEGGGEGEGAGTGEGTGEGEGTGDGSGTGEGEAGTGEGEGTGEGGEGAGDPQWFDGIDGLDDAAKESLNGLSIEDALAKIAGNEVPDEYTLPEGVEADVFGEEILQGFMAQAKEQNFSQGQMDFLLKFEADRAASFPDDIKEYNKTIFADGLATMKSELGNQKATEMVTGAKAAMKMFADESMLTFLDDSGLGDSPDLIRFFAKVGAAISEDSTSFSQGHGEVKANTPSGRDAQTAQKMYPSMAKD